VYQYFDAQDSRFAVVVVLVEIGTHPFLQALGLAHIQNLILRIKILIHAWEVRK
jgi:hypothetical protein